MLVNLSLITNTDFSSMCTSTASTDLMLKTPPSSRMNPRFRLLTAPVARQKRPRQLLLSEEPLLPYSLSRLPFSSAAGSAVTDASLSSLMKLPSSIEDKDLLVRPSSTTYS